ncbi:MULTISPECIES: hypothetical protein [Chryseobacterium]|uniref:hypothetical protein n=1 Tax=Chryseobacterium TaxID=59732 RepID=UPI001CBE3549|nr:hypothetical protein [Chryseobacterium lathyri]
MIKLTLILLSSFFLNSFCKAQKPRYIFKEYTNDLNNDKISDNIEIETVKCKNNYIGDDDYMKCRIVSIDLLQKDGTSSFSTSNYNIVPCSNCNEDLTDPFKDLKIRKNSFSFIHEYKHVPEGTKMTEVITFKYNKLSNNFILHKKVRIFESYKNGEIESNTKVETVKDFGIIYFSDYR